MTYQLSDPDGMRVLSATHDNGTTLLVDNTTYPLAAIDFTNSCGDSCTMLADGQA